MREFTTREAEVSVETAPRTTRSPKTVAESADGGAGANEVANLEAIFNDAQSARRRLEFRLGLLDLGARELETLWHRIRDQLDLSRDDDLELAGALLGRLAELEPERAIAEATELGVLGRGLLADLVAVWWRSAPGAAFEWIREADRALGEKAMAAVLADVGRRDRKEAMELFREAVASGTIGPGVWDASDFFREWTREDPQAAADGAAALRDVTKTDRALEVSLGSWAKRDAEAAIEWLDGNQPDGPRKNRLTFALVKGWGKVAPRQAGDFALGIADVRTRNRALVQVVSDWVPAGFSKAAEWVLGLDEGDAKHEAEYALVNESRIRGNPEEGLAHAIARFPENRGLTHAIYMHSTRVLSTDPLESFAWIDKNFDEPLLRESLTTVVLHKIRQHDPELALKHIDRMEEPLYRADLYGFFAELWAERDRGAAREWLAALPPSRDRTWASAGIFRQILDEDPGAAREWMEATKPGPELDEFKEQYALHLMRSKLEEAHALAQTIDHEYLRDYTLERILRRWLRSDAPRARELIRASKQLSATSKWRLLGDE